jgi:hypothetical protein
LALRFVSQFTNYVINIQPAVKRVGDFGVEILRPDILAEFQPHNWTQRDLETAVVNFKFRGVYQHEDEATPVHPAYRLSTYDTEELAEAEGWDEETKTLIEQRLLSAKAFGRDYVLVQEVAMPAPWPSYDEFAGTAEELAMQVLDLGYSPEEVIAYESSKWGQQREDVIAALSTAVEARDAGEIIVT